MFIINVIFYFQSYPAQGGYPSNMPDYQEMEDHRYRLLLLTYNNSFMTSQGASVCYQTPLNHVDIDINSDLKVFPSFAMQNIENNRDIWLILMFYVLAG